MHPPPSTSADVRPDLAQRVRGELLAPGQPGYDRARTLFNGRIERRPALVLRALTTSDVAAAVEVAGAAGLPLAVKAGGHGVAGHAVCDDGLVVDLGLMASVRVDRMARLAHVQPGVRWGAFDRATEAHGLATTGAVDSRSGVAGFTLGGGNGHLARRFGLTSDNLVAADVVTASGAVVRCSEDEHGDLFWALRGGGPSFGIVTSFALRLHEFGPEVLQVRVLYAAEDAEGVLRGWRDLMAEAPEAVSVRAALVRVPSTARLASRRHGRPAVALTGLYAGPVAEGARNLVPFAELARPLAGGLRQSTYVDLQAAFDPGRPEGARYRARSRYLRDLDDEAVATLVEHAGDLPGGLSAVGIEPLGGASGRIAADATAFAHRAAAFRLTAWGGSAVPADDAAVRAWADALHEAMAPHGTGGACLDHLDDDEPHRVPEAHGAHLGRLQAIKRTWDPTNLFRTNHDLALRRSTGARQ